MIMLTEITEQVKKQIQLTPKESFNKKLMLAEDDNERLGLIYDLLKKEEDSGAYLSWDNNSQNNNMLYYEIVHIVGRLRATCHIPGRHVETKDFALTWKKSYNEYDKDSMPEFFIKEK